MPQIAYCTDEVGYYTHAEVCTIDPIESARQGKSVYVLPANGYLDAPVITNGCVAKRENGSWVNVENHVGEKGYVNGVPIEIMEYGPLPEGWSDTPPPPTTDDLFASLRVARDARLTATDKYLLADYPIDADALSLVKAYRAALRNLPDQPGAPWTDGDIPWPIKPNV